MKKTVIAISMILVLLLSAFTGCSSGPSDSRVYDTPQIEKISSARTGVSISISPVEGVASYRILRKNEDQKWTVYAHTKTLSYLDEDVEGAKEYSYTVLCESEDGKTPLSDYDREGKSITFIETPQLSKVTNVYSGVKIEWSASKGAQKYRVLRRSGSSDTWEKIADTKLLNYIDETVQSGEEYCYTVRCVSSNGTVRSAYDAAGLAVTYVAAPELSAVIAVNGTIRVSWHPVKGADQYRVYRKTGEESFSRIGDTADRFFIDENIDLESGATYTYSVRCLDINGKMISSYDPVGISVTA